MTTSNQHHLNTFQHFNYKRTFFWLSFMLFLLRRNIYGGRDIVLYGSSLGTRALSSFILFPSGINLWTRSPQLWLMVHCCLMRMLLGELQTFLSICLEITLCGTNRVWRLLWMSFLSWSQSILISIWLLFPLLWRLRRKFSLLRGTRPPGLMVFLFYFFSCVGR